MQGLGAGLGDGIIAAFRFVVTQMHVVLVDHCPLSVAACCEHSMLPARLAHWPILCQPQQGAV
jgi:hypothetical protein